MLSNLVTHTNACHIVLLYIYEIPEEIKFEK